MFRPAQKQFAIIFGSVGTVTTFHGLFKNDDVKNFNRSNNLLLGLMRRYAFNIDTNTVIMK